MSTRALAAVIIDNGGMDPLKTYSRRLTVFEVISSIAIVIVLGILLYFLWQILNNYIAPGDDPTQRKDLVQAFVLIVGGLVAFGTLLIGWRNLRHNQRTLLVNQQITQETLSHAQELENQRAQGAALQSYFEQMGKLLTEHDLLHTDRDDIRLLARAQTLTVLEGLDTPQKNRLLRFLVGSDLVQKREDRAKSPLIDLEGTDLSGANLRGADLSRADLRGADLRGATLGGATLLGTSLSGANLSRADLGGIDLRGADLSRADLGRANLGRAKVTAEQLETVTSLRGATMPDGSTHD